MDQQQFEQAWMQMRAKLTSAECEMLDAVISGAEVSYSIIYMIVALALGLVGGWSAARLWG